MCSLMQERVHGEWSHSPARNRTKRDLAAMCFDIQRPLVEQSVPIVPPSVPLRVLMALWFVHCLVIAVAFTSNLVGIFTSPVYPRRLQHLQEIADSKYRSLFDTNKPITPAADNSRHPAIFKDGKCLELLQTKLLGVGGIVSVYFELYAMTIVIGDIFGRAKIVTDIKRHQTWC